jgi:hypothetical protein
MRLLNGSRRRLRRQSTVSRPTYDRHYTLNGGSRRALKSSRPRLIACAENGRIVARSSGETTTNPPPYSDGCNIKDENGLGLSRKSKRHIGNNFSMKPERGSCGRLPPPRSQLNLQPFAQKGKRERKKRILFGLLYLRQVILPGTGYWILDTTGLQKFKHSLSCLGRHSRILVESPPFGKVSESLGNIGYRKGTIQADRFIRLRLVSMCTPPFAHGLTCSPRALHTSSFSS